MRARVEIGALAATAVILVALESLIESPKGGSIILTLAFWKAVSEGAVALAAVAELARAKWIGPIKRSLLSLYPLILLTTILLALLATRPELYPWPEAKGIWLNMWVFLGRNFGASLLLYLLAWRLAADPYGSRAGRGTLVVVFLLAFVLSQSLLAFDVVMSLEHPWISTLLGGYFFIEALYAGMAVAGLICFFSMRNADSAGRRQMTATLKDVATLIFGFSLLWAGLFYAQFLVIWYGNIPEEAGFLVRRLAASPVRDLAYSSLVALFFAPFLLLLSRRAKSNPAFVVLASLFVLYGVLVERIVFLAPVTDLNPLMVVPEYVLLVILAALIVRGKTRLPRARP